jgi:uncharacterized Zn-binding protein involved in type VI secretion
MRNVVRLNDPTSHGGKVTSVAASQFIVDGAPVACVGDKCSCPVHGDGTIVEGDAHHTINDVAVAYDGQLTSCGAMLISTVKTFERT